MENNRPLIVFRRTAWKMKLYLFFLTLFASLAHGLSGTDEVSVSVMDGDSVTFHTGVLTNQHNRIRWYYNGIRIAEISGDLSYSCTDVQCNEDTERFRHRLKLDHQTGSLTITNTHSGLYHLEVISSSSVSEKIFTVSVRGVSAVETDEVKMKSVKEGECVTLDTGVIMDFNYVMIWYFNEILITEITEDQSKICTDVQCKERLRDRLKLDYQTGSLTITDTRNTDSGLYKLEITNSTSIQHFFSISSKSVKRFSVSVSDAVRTIRVNMGKAVTLDSDVTKIPKYVQLQWKFGDEDTLIAAFNGTNVVFSHDGRFKDRIIYHENGSLTISDIGIEHSGLYHLEIISSRHTLVKRFNVLVTAVAAEHEHPGYISLICVAVLLLAGAVSWIIYCRRISRRGHHHLQTL